MARKSFEKQMRQWRKRSAQQAAQLVERVVVSVDELIVRPTRVDIPRIGAVSVSLEEHGMVVTSRRNTREQNTQGAVVGRFGKQPYRRTREE